MPTLPPRSAHLTLAPGAGASSIEVDGQRLYGVIGLELKSDPNSLPVLTLDIRLHEVDVDGEMTVQVPENTRAALVALGWTPPVDTA